MYKNIQELLLKNKYYIHVTQIDKRMIVAHFSETNKRTYIINHDGLDFISGEDKKCVKCDPCMKRILILQDLYMTVSRLKLSMDMIIVFNKEDKVLGYKEDLFSCLQEPHSQEQRQAEVKLYKALIEYINNGIVDVDESMKDNYELLMKGFDR